MVSDRHTIFLQQCANNMVQKEAELSWGINVLIIVHCNEEYSGVNRGIALKAAHVWGSNWWINTYILWQRGSLCERNASQVDIFQEASQYCLPLRTKGGLCRNCQIVKVAYINQLGSPIYQDDGITKERGNNGKIYILRGELEYVVIIP